MTPSQLRPPTKDTLKRYGLTQDMWFGILDLQGDRCSACGLPFTEERRPCIDHYHVRGYKKMTAEKKARYVRGLLHLYCNLRLIPNGMTTEKAYNIYVYLRDFDLRLTGD